MRRTALYFAALLAILLPDSVDAGKANLGGGIQKITYSGLCTQGTSYSYPSLSGSFNMQCGSGINTTANAYGVMVHGDSDLGRRCHSMVIEAPASTTNYWTGESVVQNDNVAASSAFTGERLFCIAEPGGAGDSVPVILKKCNDAGTCTVMENVTCDNTGTYNSGAWTVGTADAGDHFLIYLGVVVGAPARVLITWCGYYTGMVRTGPPTWP